MTVDQARGGERIGRSTRPKVALHDDDQGRSDVLSVMVARHSRIRS